MTEQKKPIISKEDLLASGHSPLLYEQGGASFGLAPYMKKKRGRPPIPGGPQTAAQRQAARRGRMAATIGRSVAALDDTMHHIEQMHLKAENKKEILMALALIAQDLSDYDKTGR